MRPTSPSEVPDWITAWDPKLNGVQEALHARFVHHRYPPHIHDTWVFAVMSMGAASFGMGSRRHEAGPMRAFVIPPSTVHDGWPSSENGYEYKVLYVQDGFVDSRLAAVVRSDPVINANCLVTGLLSVHRSLVDGDTRLQTATAFESVLQLCRERVGDHDPPGAESDIRGLEKAREYLDFRWDTDVTLDELAGVAAMSKWHLVRKFKGAFGIPPHSYQIMIRIDRARKMLLAGQPAAEVAVTTGFYDQAHFTRLFDRVLGTTPGRYARSWKDHPPTRARDTSTVIGTVAYGTARPSIRV